MKKVGIITMYHNSCNYGGLLQAYSLCKYINDHGCFAEQIDYKSSSVNTQTRFSAFLHADFKIKCRKIKTTFKNTANRKLTNWLILDRVKCRIKSVEQFRNTILHTEKVYDLNSIAELNDSYDIFIAGSDRVWSPDNIESPYFLSFVEGKTKASYAASVPANTLTDVQEVKMKKALSDFSFVSVREKKTVSLISKCSPVNVEWVVDPTLLLETDDWYQLIKDIEPPIQDYIFCYFLGSDSKNRKIASDFAKKSNLKIITIPFANDKFNTVDFRFGDIQKSDVSPEMFVSLIKNAEYVFTDSFHATVISTIFHTEVFSLARSEFKGSGSRLESFTEMIGTVDHYCTGKSKNVGYCIDLKSINYEQVDKKLFDMREKSKSYLETILNFENER